MATHILKPLDYQPTHEAKVAAEYFGTKHHTSHVQCGAKFFRNAITQHQVNEYAKPNLIGNSQLRNICKKCR